MCTRTAGGTRTEAFFGSDQRWFRGFVPHKGLGGWPIRKLYGVSSMGQTIQLVKKWNVVSVVEGLSKVNKQNTRRTTIESIVP